MQVKEPQGRAQILGTGDGQYDDNTTSMLNANEWHAGFTWH